MGPNGSGQDHNTRKKSRFRIELWPGQTKESVMKQDPRHAELMIKEMDLVDGKDVVTQAIHEEGRTSDDIETYH